MGKVLVANMFEVPIDGLGYNPHPGQHQVRHQVFRSHVCFKNSFYRHQILECD
jgi:hypothetical protein